MMEFDGKVVVITGGTKGIGRATVRRFCEDGATTIIISRNGNECEAYANELLQQGFKTEPIAADISKISDINQMVEKVINKFKKIDILVNCAGVNVRKPVEEYTEEDWNYMVDINLKGTFFTCLEVGKYMIKQNRGTIINLASLQSEEVLPERAIYAATKGGVRQLTKALAVEWAKYGIRVNAVSPAFIETPMVKKVLSDPKWNDLIVSRTPMGRPGKPEEVAEFIAFLASPRASYITGVNFMIDGGWTAG